ncbi:MAG: MAPEG family protein [Proteobacteria bacterium]|nr:MAPEG family protein [Pseudomonadota bacterium]
MFQPMLSLIIWTCVVWCLMYATRLPAMHRAGIDARAIKRKEDLDSLPIPVKQIADNYNHLHEQPTVFYALALMTQVAGLSDSTNVSLAWTYVGLRVVHSIVQCFFNYVPLRFGLFVLSSVTLFAIVGRLATAIY